MSSFEQRKDSRAANIVGGLGSLTAQSILNAFLGFILFASLVRFLPLADYGTYSSVQVSVGIAGSVSVFGLSSAIVRFLAPESQEGGAGWGATKAALNLSVLLSGTVSIFMVAVAPSLSAFFAKDASLTWAFYLGAAWLFTSSLATAFQAILQGMRKYSFLAKVLLGSRLLAVAVGVAGVAIFRSLAIAIASQALFFGLVVVAAIPLVWRPILQADAKPHYSRVMRYGYLLGLASVVGAVAGNADIVVVGGYLSLASLGVYNAAIQISSVLSAFFVGPLVTALFAEASFSAQNEGELRFGTSLAIRFSMVTLLPASLLAAAMAPQLFGLFSGGGSYAQGIPYLELITLFYVFAALQTIAISILQGVSRTRSVLLIGTSAAAGQVFLSALLVPRLGLAGAAYSRVAIMVLGCVISLFLIKRYLIRPFDLKFMAKALVVSSLPAFAVFMGSVYLSNQVITIFPYTFLGLAIFLASGKMLKLLSKEDKAFLLHLFPVGLRWIIRLF